jgi:hypothetical protein
MNKVTKKKNIYNTEILNPIKEKPEKKSMKGDKLSKMSY